MHSNLVILAGGISSRMKKGLKPADEAMNKPKSMIGVGNAGRPLMDYLLYNAREAGCRDVVIVIGENDNTIRDQYGPKEKGNSFHGLTISYAVQKILPGRSKPWGTADALYQALLVRPDWRGQKFIACNSDNLYSQKAFRLLLEDPHPGALIDYDRDALRFESSRIEQFAVIRKAANGFLTGIVEKPSPQQLDRLIREGGRIGVSMNLFSFSYDTIFPILEKVPIHPGRQEKELPRAVMMLIQDHPQAVFTIPLSETVPDLTHPGDIQSVKEYLEKAYPRFTWG